jgi:hypothetical protein
MTTSPSPIGFPAPRQGIAKVKLKKAEDYASIAQLVEAFIPKFKREEERQFYSEVARSYREAARDILWKAWSEDKGQDIAEYAVMLAVILILVVGRFGLSAQIPTPSSRKLPVLFSEEMAAQHEQVDRQTADRAGKVSADARQLRCDVSVTDCDE